MMPIAMARATATARATAKPTATATAKPTEKPTATATAKPAATATAKPAATATAKPVAVARAVAVPKAAAMPASAQHAPPTPGELTDEMKELSIARAFQMFDIDRSGGIDARELQQALAQLGMEVDSAQARQVLAEYDCSGQGKLDLHGFSRLVEALIAFQAGEPHRASQPHPASQPLPAPHPAAPPQPQPQPQSGSEHFQSGATHPMSHHGLHHGLNGLDDSDYGSSDRFAISDSAPTPRVASAVVPDPTPALPPWQRTHAQPASSPHLMAAGSRAR